MNGDCTYVFEKEKISRAMVQLAVPSILVSIVDLIYSMINQYFVGMLKNSAMIAAISTVSTIDILIESVGICVGIGGASYLGRILGARSSSEKIYETVRTSMTLCLSLTVLHMIVGFLMLKPYVLWQTKDAENVYGTFSTVEFFVDNEIHTATINGRTYKYSKVYCGSSSNDVDGITFGYIRSRDKFCRVYMFSMHNYSMMEYITSLPDDYTSLLPE